MHFCVLKMYRTDHVGVVDDFMEYVGHEEVVWEEPNGVNFVEDRHSDMVDPQSLEYIEYKAETRKYRMVNRPHAQTYYCNICQKTLKYPSKIEEHMRKHNGIKPFECEVCGSRFSQGHVLKAHMRQHLGEKPFKCSYCDKSFPSAGQKNSHEKSHCHDQNKNETMHLEDTKIVRGMVEDGVEFQYQQSPADQEDTEQVYLCAYENCGMQSIHCEEVEAHIQNVHGEVWYEDGDFETAVAYDEDLPDMDSREEVIYGEYTYHGQPSDSRSCMEHQSLAKENPQIYDSSMGPSTSGISEAKMEIMEDHMPSNARILRNNNGMYDIMMEEGGYDQIDAVRVMVDPNPSKRNGMATQMQMLVDPSVVELIAIKDPPKNERRKRVKPAKNLDWIIDAVAKGHDVDLSSPHNRRKPKVHVCEYCGKIDKYPSKIEAHRRTHTGIKPYKCDICGMRFSQRTPMRLHVRRHLGHKPYRCCEPGCDEDFVSGALLNQHMAKKHWNQKKYICMRGCGRCFASSFNQRQHEKKCYFNRDETVEQEYYDEYDKEQHGLDDLEREIDDSMFVTDGLLEEEIVDQDDDDPSNMLQYIPVEDIKTETPMYQALYMRGNM